MAHDGERSEWLRSFSRSRLSFTRQHESVTRFPASRTPAVAKHLGSSQSTRAGARGTSFPIAGPVDSPTPSSASSSGQTLRRSPSSSVRAVCVNAHVPICAGGSDGRPYRDSWTEDAVRPLRMTASSSRRPALHTPWRSAVRIRSALFFHHSNNRKVIRHVKTERRNCASNAQRVRPDLQGSELHIVTIIDGGRVYSRGASADVPWGQCDSKNLRLNAFKVLNRLGIELNA